MQSSKKPNAAAAQIQQELVGTKLDVAKKNILSLVEHLYPTDMFSLIIFDDASFFFFFFIISI